MINKVYKTSLALLTDLYQLTMANGYWKSGMEGNEAVFHMFFRKNPFDGGYTISGGLETVVEYLDNFEFDDSDIEYLATIEGNDGKPLFEKEFLEYLRNMKFSCDIDAVPEGTVVFPFEPLIRVKGPIIQCQILETVLLNIINFQTLITTKAARIVAAAQGEPVLEFGLRRAQGIDGALSASRSAYIGGCASTSNVLAGKLFGIPVKGTHAHSWVMSFEDEMEAFQAYAEAMPNNCVFLVDTYNTLEGVKKAVEAGKWLREQGKEMVGIRLDSGDLAYLSIEARKILDEAGFPKAAIVASNDLDENIIASLKLQGAKIDVWGVGTKLVTAYDQPALGGVYKLSAIRESGIETSWRYTIKLSEQSIKVSNPGILQVRRFEENGEFKADAIFNIECYIKHMLIIDPMDPTRQKTTGYNAEFEDLLVPIFEKGTKVYVLPTINVVRDRVKNQLSKLHEGVKRHVNPHQYPVGLESNLYRKKSDLIAKARKIS